MAIRIGIVDDHPAMVMGTAAVLRDHPGLRLVATASTVDELLAAHQPLDLVLLDLSLADGSTPTRNIHVLTPVARVLTYTAGDRPHLIREAARAGAIGMVRKSDSAEAIVSAIQEAGDGIVVAPPEWAAALDSDPDLPSAGLSPREAEVLALYASGETAERVAEALFISRETVIDHIRRIRSKYAAASRPAVTKIDLFRRAQEDGLIPE